MIVTGGNITTKIVTVNTESNVTLAANISIGLGDAVTFTEDLYGNACFVSDQIEITTTANHDYVLDSADPQSTLIGHNIRLYNYCLLYTSPSPRDS